MLRTAPGDGLRAVGLVLAAGFLIASTEAVVKSAVRDVSVVDAIWGRHIGYVIALAIVAGRHGPRALLRTEQRPLQLARGSALFLAMSMFYVGLATLPLADVSALGSAAPLFVVGLAAPLLGERVTRPAWAGTILGFGGVVLLVGLQPSGLSPALLLPIGSAILYALYELLTRRLRHEPRSVSLFYGGVVGLVGATLLALVIPRPALPTPGQWAIVLGVGVVALVAHWLFIAAFRLARASDLAAFGYSNLVWAFVYGALVFGEPTRPAALAGAAAIVVGGVLAVRSLRSRDDLPSPVEVDYGDPAPADRGA